MYYKIIKVFAARLKDVNLDLLSSQQPAYLRKRFIGESGRLLQIFTAWKVSKYRVISGPNAEKYGTEITPYLHMFHAVILDVSEKFNVIRYLLTIHIEEAFDSLDNNLSITVLENIGFKSYFIDLIIFFSGHRPTSLLKMSLFHRCFSNILLVKTNDLVYP